MSRMGLEKVSEHRYWRGKAIDLLGGRCAKCKCRDKRCLELDHINGDACFEGYRRDTLTPRRYSRGMSSSDIRRLIESGELYTKIQVLCANHHSIKTYEEEEYKRRGNVQMALPLLEWGRI